MRRISIFSVFKSAVFIQFNLQIRSDQPLRCMGTHHGAGGGEPTPGTLSHCGATSSKHVTYAPHLSIYFSVFKIEEFLSVVTQIYNIFGGKQ